MAAEQVQLPADDPRHRHARVALDRRQQADLDVPAPPAQAEDRVGAGLLAAHGVDGDVAAPAGEGGDRRGDVAPVRAQRVLRAELAGEGERLRVAVDRDHASAQCPGDHHRAEPHPAGSDHGDPLPLGEARPVGQGPVRRGEPAPQRGRGGEVDVLGDGHEVRVGPVQGDVLGEGPPVGEPRLLLSGADLRVAGAAPLAPAAAADEGDGHPVPGAPAAHARPHRDDHPGQLVPGDVGQRDLVVPGPGVPVAAAQARGLHADDHPVGRCRGLGDVTDLRPAPDSIDHHCAHAPTLPRPCGTGRRSAVSGPGCGSVSSRRPAGSTARSVPHG